jgi:hypothetical protein
MSEKMYVATEDLYLPGPERQKAFNKGDNNVPASSIKQHGWEDQTVGANTKAAAEARGEQVEEESKRNVTTGGGLTPGKGDK